MVTRRASLPRLRRPRKRLQVLGVGLNRSESGGQPASRTRLSPPPPAFGERRHRRLARRLVASARAYVGFVRANGSRGRPETPVPNPSVKNVRVAGLRASD